MENFENSELYLNRLTVEKGRIRFSDGHIKNVEELGLSSMPSLKDWSEKSVEKRAELIWSLIREDMRTSFRE